jgi:antitoxin (DNA-binding transcriptional repressor) of toxin-antitoxin stability system
MRVVNIDAAKTNLSRLIELACEPVAKLAPIGTSVPRRRRGSLEGEVFVPGSFFDPLPTHELDVWGQ